METQTLESVRQRVLDRDATLSDTYVSVKSLSMDEENPGIMNVRCGEHASTQSYPIDDYVYSQLSSVVSDCPGAYLRKLVTGDNANLGLAAANFNWWVENSRDREVLLRLQRRGDGDVLRAVRPATWNPIPYQDSIDTLITKYGPDKEVQARLCDRRLVIDVVTEKLELGKPGPHVRTDDPFEWGMRFQDSDIGLGDLQVMPYTRRLVCLNGMTSFSRCVIMNISHSGKQSALPAEVQSNVRQGIELINGYSERVSEQIIASKNIQLDCDDNDVPKRALDRLQRDMDVTKLMAKHVVEGWHAERETIPEPTLYRLTNAVTRAGTHAEELNDTARLHLQGVGGRILECAVLNYHWN